MDNPQQPKSGEQPPADVDDAGAARLPSICWWFAGLAVYRAWIEVAFVGTFVDFPAPMPLRDLYDVAIIAGLALCTVFSSRLSPLHVKKPVLIGCAMAMSAAGLLEFAAMADPGLAQMLAPPASVLGGLGAALVILLWSELYGCLNPVRIALYYALSQLVGAAVIWTLRGFLLPWLVGYTALLPFVSVWMLLRAYATVAPEHLPKTAYARFSFPWKPVALVSIYAFAYGLGESHTYSLAGPHSGPGMIVAAAVVVAGILLFSKRVEFGTIYAGWLPALMMVSLLVSLLAPAESPATGFFTGVSYAAAETFIMTMIGSICYRYGVGAVWIFGIERSVRLVAMMAGRALGSVSMGWPVTALVVVGAAVGTWLIFSERDLTADWGVVLYREDEDLYQTALKNARTKACGELARTYGLTGREEEVLLMLANRKTASDIERELCVANGTAKAHIRHVYRKLGIHARDELFALVDDKAMTK